MKIGIQGKGYAYTRIITSCRLGNYINVRWNNWYLWLRLPYLVFLHLRLVPRNTQLLYKLHYEYKPIFTICDILHLYSTTNFSKEQPWVLSIEHCVPYSEIITNCLDSANGDFSCLKDNLDIEKVLKACALSNCKKIIAISECTRQIQLAVAKSFPQYFESISNKLVVAHPPQPLLINNIDEKNIKYEPHKKFTFVFVGNHFYRKGGREILEVLSKLHKQFDFQLYLIGDASLASFKAPMLSNQDIPTSLKTIEENKEWIHYSKKLPNQEVIDIIKHSHVALLPTWSDSYGFSVLECQACGTPVISTSIRSLPELNNIEVGWIINVPTNAVNHPIISTQEERLVFHKALTEGLYICCKEALSNPERIKAKAEMCLKRIKNQHDPADYSHKMKDIYLS